MMTVGGTVETCGGQTEALIGKEEKMEPSVTTLSTIAIQAGQSQITVSVLKSGSVVHLQLVEAHPGLCEVGANHEENQTLIWEQQQLMDKLQKHKQEVLAVVDKSRQAEQRRRVDEGVKKRRKQEEEGRVHEAMRASLSEGWSLLLRLLDRRREVLRLASHFYQRLLEFADGIDKVEDLQTGTTDVRLTYAPMRKDLLEKSLKVLTSSGVLLPKLRQLQWIEAFQRRGGLLQDVEGQEECSQCCGGVASRLEQLVETLQDRRRRADQAVRLLLQQDESNIKTQPEPREAECEPWDLTGDKVLNQNLQSGSTSEGGTEEMRNVQTAIGPTESRILRSRFRLNKKRESQPELKADSEKRNQQSRSRTDQRPGSEPHVQPDIDLKSEPRPDQRKEPDSSDVKSGLKLGQTRRLQSRLGSDLDSECCADPELVPEETTDLETDLEPEPLSDLRIDSPSESDMMAPCEPAVTENSGSTSTQTTEDLRSKQRPAETRNLQPGFMSDRKAESRLDLKSDFKAEETRNLESGSRSDQKPGSESDVQPGVDLTPESGSYQKIKSDSGSNQNDHLQSSETKTLGSGSISGDSKDLRSDSKPKETGNTQTGAGPSESRILQSELRLNVKAESRLDLHSGSKAKETSDPQPGATSDQRPGLQSDVQTGLDLKPESELEQRKDSDTRSDLIDALKSAETRIPKPGSRRPHPESRSQETTRLQPGLGSKRIISPPSSDLMAPCEPAVTENLNSGSTSTQTTDLQPETRPAETRTLQSESRFNRKAESRSDLKPDPKAEETGNLLPDLSTDQRLGSESNVQSGVDLTPESGSDHRKKSVPQSGFILNWITESRTDLEKRSLESGSRSDQRPGSQPSVQLVTDLEPECGSDPKDLECRHNLKVLLKPAETRTLQLGARRLDSASTSKETANLQPQPGPSPAETRNPSAKSGSEGEGVALSEVSGKQEETNQRADATTNTDREPGNTTATPPTNPGQEHLPSSCERLVNKIWSWVQQGSSVLANRCETGQQFRDIEDTLNTHLQLHTESKPVDQDAKNLRHILNQINALHPDSTSRTSPHPPSEPSRQLRPLRALTEQLKRKGGAPRPSPPAPLSPELCDKADEVLHELQTLRMKINSNLQFLKPLVTFLRTARQVEQEMEEYRRIFTPRSEEKESDCRNNETTNSCRSPLKKKQVDVHWEETLQKFLTAQEVGNNLIYNGRFNQARSDLYSVEAVVLQTLEQLSRTKEEVNDLLSRHQTQVQQQLEDCRKYRERLTKTQLDLQCVSELLNSCTVMDLGSDLETSRLLKRFKQARPHFTKLDGEVEFMEKSWETVRGMQDQLEIEQVEGKVVKEEDLLEILKLQNRLKTKIHQCESILDLSSRFHLMSRQLEVLLVSPSTDQIGSCGSSEAELNCHKEEQLQVQNLFQTISSLKMDICTAVGQNGWTAFRVEQLEARLLSLDSLRVSWLKEAAQREEKQRQDLLTCRLHDDITQLRDSFRELKKRFSNLKFNYLKRNDRTRNMKAVRNQLQQVELHEEKLQALRKRLQGVTVRLGSEVKDGGVAREAEDAINELQRQMGDFERSVSDHQKTLELTRRLQRAMEEYQFWCEEASATIARVGRFSTECRSTDAISVLYQQFEKFVWPTVPEQEERISQIAELAVRLHGAEEGRRYIERTVSKHLEMVGSIRELSDRLMGLEAKLKMESIEKQQNDEEKEVKEGEREETDGMEEKDEEKEKLKDNRDVKNKKQTDNRKSQEAFDMSELKETGHTPELSTKHEQKEVPVKRQTASSGKPPLQKAWSHKADRQEAIPESSHSGTFTSSYCFARTMSLSCSPVEANRRIHTIHGHLQPDTTDSEATPLSPVVGPLFSDIQREFQRKKDTPAEGLSEVELQDQEAMTEDFLSSDEYECASPDDISLPPLAETPESNVVQSDLEEGHCFSSRSAHSNQHSHQGHSHLEYIGNGAVQEQRVLSQAKCCPTPPSSLQSSTRCGSELTSRTIPGPILLTSTLYSTLKTSETITASEPPMAELPMGTTKLNPLSGSNPVNKGNVTDNTQCKCLQRRTGNQIKMAQNVPTDEKPLPRTDCISQAVELNHSSTLPKSNCYPRTCSYPDPDLDQDKTFSQDIRLLKRSSTLPQTIDTDICITDSPASNRPCSPQRPFSQGESLLQMYPVRQTKQFSQGSCLKECALHKNRTTGTGFAFLPQSYSSQQAKPAVQGGDDQKVATLETSEEKSLVFLSQHSTLTTARTVTQRHIDCKLSPPLNNHDNVQPHNSKCMSQKGSTLCKSETTAQIDPDPQVSRPTESPGLTDSVADQGQDTRCAINPQGSSGQPAYSDSRSGLDHDVPFSKTSIETCTLSIPQGSSLITTNSANQKHTSSTQNHKGNFPKNTSSPTSQQGSTSHQDNVGLPELHDPAPLEPNHVSDIDVSNSDIKHCSEQNNQIAFCFHKSSTFTCTQQSVHDPGMTPSSPAKTTAAPQPEPQTHALAQQSHLHDSPISSSPQLLTSGKDPNICQPMAIREEIRLTPQIKGPPLPAPSPVAQAQTESLPQGKASKPGLTCLTRPLSRATVMEGSPVTLEVEVTAHPEPTLTWFGDVEVSAAAVDRKHILSVPETSESGGPFNEAQAANHHNATPANSCSSGDKWLLAEVFDIITEDWHTWLGTLCFLLWLIYLMIL